MCLEIATLLLFQKNKLIQQISKFSAQKCQKLSNDKAGFDPEIADKVRNYRNIAATLDIWGYIGWKTLKKNWQNFEKKKMAKL